MRAYGEGSTGGRGKCIDRLLDAVQQPIAGRHRVVWLLSGFESVPVVLRVTITHLALVRTTRSSPHG